jgi:hypothetical protein
MSLAWENYTTATYLINARPVDDQRIGDDEVESFRRWPIGGLAHALTNRLACQCFWSQDRQTLLAYRTSTKFHFFTVDGLKSAGLV